MERRRLLPKRTRQPTFKLRDQLPQPPAPLTLTMSLRLSVQTDLSDNDPMVLGSSSLPSSVTDTSMTNPDTLDTQTNIFGVFHHYSTKLAKDTYDSDESLSLQDLSAIPIPETNLQIPASIPSQTEAHSVLQTGTGMVGYRNHWEVSTSWWHSLPTQILAPMISNPPSGASSTQNLGPRTMRPIG